MSLQLALRQSPAIIAISCGQQEKETVTENHTRGVSQRHFSFTMRKIDFFLIYINLPHFYLPSALTNMVSSNYFKKIGHKNKQNMKYTYKYWQINSIVISLKVMFSDGLTYKY